MKVNISKYHKSGRKIDVKIDGYDVWSFDHTLAYIILPGLIELKITKHGIPGDFVDVGGEKHISQQSFDFYEESHDEAFEEGSKRWDEVLDKMIWSFYQLIDDDWEQKYHYGEAKYEFKKLEKTMLNPITNKDETLSEMIDTNPDEHWFDVDGYELHNQRIQEGIDLFAKYYRSLWD